MAGERWASFKPDSGSSSQAAINTTAGVEGFAGGFAADWGDGFCPAGMVPGTAFDFTSAGFFASGAAVFAGDFLAGGRLRFFMT
ncbi:hypothetical protein [Verrucomicrobium spinosum]|uniref:hypothetical protein n=1 Tax=Verrucomicrobium spinosum TaxID=2736 RepID=UPI0012E27F4A|nr:hypothetical protein [Verrucomicrobium spinosum]